MPTEQKQSFKNIKMLSVSIFPLEGRDGFRELEIKVNVNGLIMGSKHVFEEDHFQSFFDYLMTKANVQIRNQIDQLST